jgi:hypothetical protein
MNPKYFATFTTIVLATGLSQPIAQAQAQKSVLNSTLNDVLVARFPKSPTLQTDVVLLHRSRQGTILLNEKKDPPPPRPSPPAGSRLTVQHLMSVSIAHS